MMSRYIVLTLLLSSNVFVWSQKYKSKEVHREIILNDQGTMQKFQVLLNEKNVSLKNDRTYYWVSNNKLSQNQGAYAGKLLDGKFERFNAGNRLIEMGHYKLGLRHGVFKKWYGNGKLKSVTKYHKGFKQGAYTEFDQEGKLILKQFYWQDVLHGKSVNYGEQEIVTKYKKGEVVVKAPEDALNPEADKMKGEGKSTPFKAKLKNFFGPKEKSDDVDESAEKDTGSNKS